MAYRWVYLAQPDQHLWVLRRNCALTPGQLGGWFGTLAGLSMLIAGVSAAQGAWVVVPFALVEVAALAGAFFAYGRHAGDYERIVATRERVLVERRCGERIDRIEGDSARMRVEFGITTRGQISLVTGQKRIAVGRFVPDDRKAELAHELHGALEGWHAG